MLLPAVLACCTTLGSLLGFLVFMDDLNHKLVVMYLIYGELVLIGKNDVTNFCEDDKYRILLLHFLAPQLEFK